MGNFEPSKFEVGFSGFVRAGFISAVFCLDWSKSSFFWASRGYVLSGEMGLSGFLEV